MFVLFVCFVNCTVGPEGKFRSEIKMKALCNSQEGEQNTCCTCNGWSTTGAMAAFPAGSGGGEAPLARPSLAPLLHYTGQDMKPAYTSLHITLPDFLLDKCGSTSRETEHR